MSRNMSELGLRARLFLSTILQEWLDSRREIELEERFFLDLDRPRLAMERSGLGLEERLRVRRLLVELVFVKEALTTERSGEEWSLSWKSGNNKVKGCVIDA